MYVVTVMQRQTQLFHVVFALGTSCCFPSLLDGRQEQGGQNCNDRIYDRQLDQCNPPSGAGSVDVHGIVWAKSANAISCIQSSGRCTSETTGTIAERDLTCGTTNATGPQLAATAADCWSVLNTRYRQQRLRIEDVPSVHQLELKDCQQRRRGLRRVVREHFGESGTHSQSSLAMASTPGFGTTLSQATTVGGGSAARNRT